MIKRILFLVAFCGSFIHLSAQTDEVLIQQLIQQETEDFCKISVADVIKKHWIMDDKLVMTVTLIDGTSMTLRLADVLQDTTVPPPNHATVKKADFVISVTGNHAYAYHHETTTLADGNIITSHITQVFEKVNGAWKIHASSVQQYKNN
jgi:hypothetical protein